MAQITEKRKERENVRGCNIPIFLMIAIKEKGFGVFNRFIAPLLSIAGSLFMVYAAFLSHGVKTVLCYLVVYAVIMIVGLIFKLGNKSHK